MTEVVMKYRYNSGEFKNGQISCLRDKDGCGEYKANKDFTCYGEYYKGEACVGSNFGQIYSDRDVEIHSVISKRGKKYSLGDYVKGINRTLIRVTEFYISDREIWFRGMEQRESLGRIDMFNKKNK